MTITDNGVIPDIDFTTRLALARKHAGMTQHEIAEQLGLGSASVGGYETGARRPKRPTVVAWAALTGVSREWLLELYTPPDSNREPADSVDWVLAA